MNKKIIFNFIFLLLSFTLTQILKSKEKQTYPNVNIQNANHVTIKFVQKVQPQIYAEFGVSLGATTLKIAKILPANSKIYLFDFHEIVNNVKNKLLKIGYRNIHAIGNSYKLRDSYNWSLMNLIEKHEKPIFDYVFLDGMHTWETDGFAFFLIDKLLKTGGYIDFDDYNWTLFRSPTLSPKVFPFMAELYTVKQMKTKSIKKIIELLVRKNKNYIEIVKNKIFQKIK